MRVCVRVCEGISGALFLNSAYVCVCVCVKGYQVLCF